MDQFFLGAHDASESCQEEILQRLETGFKLRASSDPFAGAGFKYLSDGMTLVSYAYDNNNLLFPILIYFEPLEDISGRHAAERLPPGDDFALGLQRLHWGMSPEMLKSVLPGLEFGAYGAFSVTQSYEYAGCRLDLSLWFTHDGLDWLTLNAPMASAACEQEIVQELRNTFPLPVFTATNGTLSERRENHTTSVFYDEYRGGLFVDFSAKCQSIQVSVERVVAPASGKRPEVVPDADLDCTEYPQLSVRLQEGGSVGLDVHVLKDGSVALATIVAPDKSRRINQAALRIAATRLRFTPASVNGEAVESDTTIKMDFAVIHPSTARHETNCCRSHGRRGLPYCARGRIAPPDSASRFRGCTASALALPPSLLRLRRAKTSYGGQVAAPPQS